MKHIPSNIKDKYEILGVIGEGSYGVVLKARKKDNNTTVAIKHFKQAPGYCTDIDIIERELKILQSLRFENVVELIEWFREKKQCFLVFEYVEWNMLQVLQEHPDGLPIEQVRQLSYQLFSAIYWCHSHEIIHRDIKPENLLISKNFVLKLCDFGFARFCNTQTTADYYTDYVATRWYRSPELLIGLPYGKPVDIWACGCIMAELTTGQALFAGESDIDQLYRIQKCLGPLPPKYMEALKTNPKFEGVKFPPIHHLETLERRYGHLFPPDIMDLFKGTLRLYASDRLPTDACVKHEAFVFLNQKRQQKRLKRQQQSRPKTVVGSFSTSQIQFDQSNDNAHFTTPFVDNRLSKWYDENGEIQLRRRSPALVQNNGMESVGDVSFATGGASSSFIAQQQQQKYRSTTQMTDRSSPSRRHRQHHSHHHQPKLVRAQSRNPSSSSDERVQPSAASPMSSNNTTDDDDDPNSILSHHSRLRRKYLKSSQPVATTILPASLPAPPSLSRQQSLRDQLAPPSPTLRYASNGVLLRSKHHHQQQQQPYQQHSSSILQSSAKDLGKKLKRFSLDTPENRSHSYQAVPNHALLPEPNIYRSALAIVPSLNADIYGVQVNNHNPMHNVSSSSLSKQPSSSQYLREESHQESQPRPKTRDLVRSRTIDCHAPAAAPSVETTPVLQRTPSRQTTVAYHQVVPDFMDHADVDSMASNVQPTSRSFEQQLNHNNANNNNHTNKYPWNADQRRSVYASDSYLMNSSGHNSSFNRSFYTPTKGDYIHVGKVAMGPQRDPTYDVCKSAKPSSKQMAAPIPKASGDSNRRPQGTNNLLGAFPSARTAVLHVANVLMPTSHQRQQSIRLPSTKSRHQDR